MEARRIRPGSPPIPVTEEVQIRPYVVAAMYFVGGMLVCLASWRISVANGGKRPAPAVPQPTTDEPGLQVQGPPRWLRWWGRAQGASTTP
jgi:hypothetical protein